MTQPQTQDPSPWLLQGLSDKSLPMVQSDTRCLESSKDHSESSLEYHTDLSGSYRVWSLLRDSEKEHLGIVEDIVRCLGEEWRLGEVGTEVVWRGTEMELLEVFQVFPSCQNTLVILQSSVFVAQR